MKTSFAISALMGLLALCSPSGPGECREAKNNPTAQQEASDHVRFRAGSGDTMSHSSESQELQRRLKPGERVKKYTIEEFMNTVSIGGGSFSHDEKKILFSSDQSGIFNAFVVPVEGGDPTQLTFSTTNAIFSLAFLPNDNRILYSSDTGGNEISHIYLLNENGESRDLTPGENAKASFYGIAYDEKGFYYGSNKRDPKFMDVYEMDFAEFTPTMIFKNEGAYSLGAASRDRRYLALSKTITRDNSDMYLYDTSTKELRLLSPHEGDVNFSPETFSIDSKYLYYLTDEGSEFTYVKRYDLQSGDSETVLKADWDIQFVRFSHKGTYMVVGINNDARTEIRVYDASTMELIPLPNPPEGQISSVKISKSERLMSFYVTSATSPANLYVYNFDTRRFARLTSTLNPAIDANDLVEAQRVRYTSFDGLEIPAILYKPHQAAAENKKPAIVWVHGGPGGQSTIHYDPLLQYLVNHGYVVLAVNNRGSSGYGKGFYRADNHKHGQADLADVIRAKEFLASTGYVQEAKVGIMGGSYGGYMVLAALTFQPEEFALGVDLFGVSNWLRTLKSLPSWWDPFKESLYQEIGNPETEEDYLRSISPLFHADKIVRPLMVLQGKNDPRVLKAESDEIVEAARKRDIPVEYKVFDDEGHGFLKKENRITGYKGILDFLQEHMPSGG